MTHKPEPDTDRRRILAFPAVRPCEGISAGTLMSSLATMSQNICYNYQYKSFPTHRRNAREVVRQVGILSMFFDEVMERGLTLPEAAVLCFSELHLTFQKVRFLLEDCSREGSRLWILMKFKDVTSHFRVLVRSIGTALDVLPLELVQVGREVRELVEMVGRQSRKARIEIDPVEESVQRDVELVLGHLEKGVEPDLNFMRWVLEFIGIRGWVDCEKEVKFLEEEIGFHSLDSSDQREVSFLSGLLGLMCYCRGVVFETLDFRNRERIDARCSVEVLSCLNPEDFRCPISLELMSDPVTVSTGQTYDRSSIHKWLKAGNSICPKTGERLAYTELVPNTTLRKLIHQYCTDNGISLAKSRRRSRDIARTIASESPAASGAVKLLSRFLARRLVFGSMEQKNKAAYEIRLLSKSSIYNRNCLIEAGTVSPLLMLLSVSDRYVQENAIAALLKLSKHASGKTDIFESDGLRPILAVLKEGLSLEVKQIAAATIFYLASSKRYQGMIGETPDAIPALVKLVRDGTTCGKKNAVVAIFALLLHQGNHRKVIESGLIQILLGMVSSPDCRDVLVPDLLAALAALAEGHDGTLEILRSSGLSTLTKSIRSVPLRAAKEYCASILLSLCGNGGLEVVEVLAKDPCLMSSLYSLLTEGSSQGSSKARALIKILQKFHEPSPSGLVSSAAECEWPIHIRIR